jgi:hypothetical protein
MKISKNVRLTAVVDSPEPYRAAVVKSVEEFFHTFQPEGWKKTTRRESILIEPQKKYRPGEVAAILGVSYDTAIRRMLQMEGCVDMGNKTQRYKRRKRLLVISGKNLSTYLKTKTIERM